MKTIRTVQIIEDTAMAAAESKKRTNKIIKAFIAEIKLNLCKGNSVGLFEFGTFSPKILRQAKRCTSRARILCDSSRLESLWRLSMANGFNLWLCCEAYKMRHPEMRQVLEW